MCSQGESEAGRTSISRSVLVGLAVLGAAAAFGLAWIPVRTAVSRFIVEDMFYYLQAARIIAAGGPASLDGVHVTNGFHPLWMLICTALQSVLDGPAAVHSALSLCAGLFVLTGWLLARTVGLVGSGEVLLYTPAFFLTNYRLMAVPLGGLETALAGLMIAGTTAYVLGRDPLASTRSAVILGALLGLTVLSRMDAVLFGAVLLAWIAFAQKEMNLSRVGRAVISGGVLTAFLVPWFVWSWTTSQSLLPNSRIAIKLWTGIQWDSDLSTPANLVRFAKDRVSRLIEPANDMANALGVWPFATPAESPLRYVGPLVLGGALLFLFFMGWRMRNGIDWRRVGWVPIYIALHVAYYVAFGRVTIRYLYPIAVPLLLLVSVIASAWLKQGGSRKAAASAFIVLTAFSWVAGVDSFRRGYASDRWHPLHDGLYSGLAPWIASNTPDAAIVGAFNSGILSYHCERPVVNLDGVMNNSAITALREKQIGAYLEREGVDYLADLAHEIEKFMDGFSGDPDWRTGWEEVYRTTREYGGGVGTMDLVVLEKKP